MADVIMPTTPPSSLPRRTPLTSSREARGPLASFRTLSPSRLLSILAPSPRQQQGRGPAPQPYSPGGAAFLSLRAEIRRGSLVRLLPSWERLEAAFNDVDYVPLPGMEAMCGGEFPVLCKAPPSNGVEMLVLPGRPTGDDDAEGAGHAKWYFPASAVAAVVMTPPSPMTGRELAARLYAVDTASDYLEGSVYQRVRLPPHVARKPLDDVIGYLADECEQYNAVGFWYALHEPFGASAAGSPNGSSGSRPGDSGGGGSSGRPVESAGFFMHAGDAKGTRVRRPGVRRGALAVRQTALERFEVGSSVKVRGEWQGHACFYSGTVSECEEGGGAYTITYAAAVPADDPEGGVRVATRARSEEMLAVQPPPLPDEHHFPVGCRVLATWKGAWEGVGEDGASAPWFAGEVTSANAPARAYTVLFDHGETANAILTKHLRPAPGKPALADRYAVGQRVLADAEGSGNAWLDATVREVQPEDNTLGVEYDDGHWEEACRPRHVLPVSHAYHVGQRVSCRFIALGGIAGHSDGDADGGDEEMWQSATVTAVEDGGRTYCVMYDDGDVEEGVLASCVRAPAVGNPAASYAVGERVLARYEGGPAWYMGQVSGAAALTGPSYSVSFDGIGPQAIVFPAHMCALD